MPSKSVLGGFVLDSLQKGWGCVKIMTQPLKIALTTNFTNYTNL